MQINYNKIITCGSNLACSLSFGGIGLFLGREVYKVGMREFYKPALNSSLCLPAFLLTVFSVAGLFFSLAFPFLPGKEEEPSIIRAFMQSSIITAGAIMTGGCCFNYLVEAALAGNALPAYIISSLTISFAAMSILVGGDRMHEAWKALTT